MTDAPSPRLCLVVDDSRMVRRVAARIVKEMGFDTIEAENGRDALEACQQRCPDVVLLDWNMPVMDGLDFMAAFRQHPGGREVPIVFCTTVRDVAKITQALRAGADEYVIKPFDSAIIESKFVQVGLLGRDGAVPTNDAIEAQMADAAPDG